jgi:hypothetical protein
MKTNRFLLFVMLMLVSSAAVAQSGATAGFEKLKALAGTWEGRMTTDPPVPDVDGTATVVTLRVTSMGNVLMHEMTGEGRPDDPITMVYLEGGGLELRHYCDAGNRPRMRGTMSPDGKKVEFEFLDVAGDMQYGHMHRAVFTFLDENRHAEEWTFMRGGKPYKARIELHRKK